MTNGAAHDPKYDTFIKRLVSFKQHKTKGQKAETDEQFCERLGISISKYRNWLYRGVEPDIPSLLHLSEFLDVSPDWLYLGRGHSVENRPEEGLRVTRIPREPLEVIEEIGTEDVARQAGPHQNRRKIS
jgi:transcriptional regulator with XRE-family HTH domain